MGEARRCTNCDRFPFCNYDYTNCLVPYIQRFGNPQGPINIKDYWIKRQNKNIKRT